MDAEKREKLSNAIHNFFVGKGLRQTAQREAILTAIFSSEEYFSAEGLLRMVRAANPSVSRATVYRNLALLLKSGLLHELDLGDGIQYYDPNFGEHPTHHHLMCVDCEKIIEFEDTNIELLENCISRRLGFSPANKMLRIKAHCDELRLHGNCQKRRDQEA